MFGENEKDYFVQYKMAADNIVTCTKKHVWNRENEDFQLRLNVSSIFTNLNL